MMVWLTVPLVFPQSSDALYLHDALPIFPHVPAVVVAPRSCTVAPPQVSLAVGAVKVGEAGHSTVPLLPCPPIAGAVVSTTVIVWFREALVLPQLSTACQVLVSE